MPCHQCCLILWHPLTNLTFLLDLISKKLLCEPASMENSYTQPGLTISGATLWAPWALKKATEIAGSFSTEAGHLSLLCWAEVAENRRDVWAPRMLKVESMSLSIHEWLKHAKTYQNMVTTNHLSGYLGCFGPDSNIITEASVLRVREPKPLKFTVWSPLGVMVRWMSRIQHPHFGLECLGQKSWAPVMTQKVSEKISWEPTCSDPVVFYFDSTNTLRHAMTVVLFKKKLVCDTDTDTCFQRMSRLDSLFAQSEVLLRMPECFSKDGLPSGTALDHVTIPDFH